MCVVLSEETWWVTKVRQGIVADRSDESVAHRPAAVGSVSINSLRAERTVFCMPVFELGDRHEQTRTQRRTRRWSSTWIVESGAPCGGRHHAHQQPACFGPSPCICWSWLHVCVGSNTARLFCLAVTIEIHAWIRPTRCFAEHLATSGHVGTSAAVSTCVLSSFGQIARWC
jgi:hypothetical protein